MIDYILYDEEQHLNGVVKLEKILWTNHSFDQLKEIFKWKYPVSKGRAKGFVALSDGVVVGFRGLFIQNYKYNDEVVPVAVLGDAAVDPAYQGKGIFSNLTRIAIETCRDEGILYILGLSSNSKSSPGYLKMGWRPLIRKKFYIGFSITNLIRRTPRRTCHIRHCELELHDYSAIVHYIDEFCEVAHTAAPNDLMCIDKNQDYWAWRFKNPDWNPQFITLRENGAIQGTITFIHEKTRGITSIKVLDVTCNNKRYLPILFRGLKEMTNSLIYFILPGGVKANHKIYKRFFPFCKLSNAGNPSDYYLIKNIATDDTKVVDWDITYASID